MARYVLCPRCELNFIDADAQEYCDVCLKEMQGAKTFADDLEEVEEIEETELCPICGENYMRIGEKMCDECKKKTEYEEEETDDPDKDDAWRSYLDDDVEDLGIPLPEDEFEDDDDEDEDDDDYDEDEIEKSKDEDDFEYVSADDYYLDDDDDDDDDEDDPRPSRAKRSVPVTKTISKFLLLKKQR